VAPCLEPVVFLAGQVGGAKRAVIRAIGPLPPPNPKSMLKSPPARWSVATRRSPEHGLLWLRMLRRLQQNFPELARSVRQLRGQLRRQSEAPDGHKGGQRQPGPLISLILIKTGHCMTSYRITLLPADGIGRRFTAVGRGAGCAEAPATVLPWNYGQPAIRWRPRIERLRGRAMPAKHT